MKFDVVVGNPPYNNDLYVNFVDVGNKLAKVCSLWITPAKFIARKQLIELYHYFSDFIFYARAQDIFNISNLDGIAIYLVTKKHQDVCRLVNKSENISAFNNIAEVDLSKIKSINIFTDSLVNKLGDYKSILNRLNLSSSPYGIDTNVRGSKYYDESHPYHLLAGLKLTGGADDRGYISEDLISRGHDMLCKYKVCINKMLGSCSYDINGKNLGLNRLFLYKPDEVTPLGYANLMTFDSLDEAESFCSYLNSKLIRFLFCTALCSQSMTELSWRFIPDPGSFDSIFEDKPLDGYTPDENGEYIDSDGHKHCSLYVKYKLTDEEISVIESVIKDR